MAEPDSPLLEYASLPSRRRKVLRLTLRLALLLILAAAGILLYYVPAAARNGWMQRQCMVYERNMDALFDESDAPGDVSPPCWQSVWNWAGRPTGGGWPNLAAGETSTLLFLHGRISHSGNRRLIYVAAIRTKTGVEFRSTCLTPGDLTRRPVSASVTPPLVVENHPDLPLRVHSGRLDTNDARHFSFNVDYADQQYVIDGTLLDDDTVALTPSFGDFDPSTSNWDVEWASHRLKLDHPAKTVPSGSSQGSQNGSGFLSPDGKLLAIRHSLGSGHDAIDLWDVVQEKRLITWDTGTYFAWPRFSNDGTQLMGFDNGARIWSRFEIPAGRLISRVNLRNQFTDPTSAKDFFDDGRRVAISSPSSGEIRIIDLLDQVRVIRRFPVPTGLHNLSVSPDGKVVAFWQFNPRTDVTFYSSADGHVISRQAHDPGVEEFGYTADSNTFIELTNDGVVLVDVRTGAIRRRLGSGPFFRGARISSAANIIAQTAHLVLFDLPDFHAATTLCLDGQPIGTNSASLSADGKRLVALLSDGKWGIWDLTQDRLPDRR